MPWIDPLRSPQVDCHLDRIRLVRPIASGRYQAASRRARNQQAREAKQRQRTRTEAQLDKLNLRREQSLLTDEECPEKANLESSR